MEDIQLILGDCLEKMRDIPDKSIDMILCDLPYEVLHKNNPHAQWYRPSLKETLKWRGKNNQMLEHILNGGLDVRPIKQV